MEGGGIRKARTGRKATAVSQKTTSNRHQRSGHAAVKSVREVNAQIPPVRSGHGVEAYSMTKDRICTRCSGPPWYANQGTM